MIKQFIFAKLSEKFFKKAMQGDRRGIMKYFKIAIAVLILFVILIIVGMVYFIQFFFGLFSHIGTQVGSVGNIDEIKIEESIKKVKEMVPEEVSTTAEHVKAKIAPYDTSLKEVESVIRKVNDTAERFEKFIP